jgi:hypothetical protein
VSLSFCISAGRYRWSKQKQSSQNTLISITHVCIISYQSILGHIQLSKVGELAYRWWKLLQVVVADSEHDQVVQLKESARKDL